MNLYDEAIEIDEAIDGLAQFIIMNDNGTDESASAIEWHGIIKKALERAKKVEEFISLCSVETTDTGHEVVFWRDENYEYAKQLLKMLKGEMK